MTNRKIIQKAIQKAEENGFIGSFKNSGIYCEMASFESEGYCVYSTIFSHDFLKAFLGKERVCPVCGTVESDKEEIEHCKSAHESESNVPFEWDIAWQYHGCKMFLEEEPLKYLEKFL